MASARPPLAASVPLLLVALVALSLHGRGSGRLSLTHIDSPHSPLRREWPSKEYAYRFRSARAILDAGERPSTLKLSLTHIDAPHSPFRREWPSKEYAYRFRYYSDKARSESLYHLIASKESRRHPGNRTPPLTRPKLVSGAHNTTSTRSFQEVALQVVEEAFNTTVHSGYGVGIGEYFADFSLGDPAQPQILFVDTGSDLCLPCFDCYDQAGPIFDPALSSTFSVIGCNDSTCLSLGYDYQYEFCYYFGGSDCEYTYSYGDMSYTSGQLANETVWLTTTTGDSLEPYDHVFTLCLQSWYADYLPPSELEFGSAGVPSTGVTYTPILDNPVLDELFGYSTFYYVNEILFGTTSVSIPAAAFTFDYFGGGGTIFDSGTSLILLLSDVYRPIIDYLNASVPLPRERDTFGALRYELCWNIAGRVASQKDIDQLGVFPSHDHPHVRAGRLHAPPCELHRPVFVESSYYNIIGNYAQQNFLMVHDLNHTMLGWMSLNCTTKGPHLCHWRHPLRLHLHLASLFLRLLLLPPSLRLHLRNGSSAITQQELGSTLAEVDTTQLGSAITQLPLGCTLLVLVTTTKAAERLQMQCKFHTVRRGGRPHASLAGRASGRRTHFKST
eukprot:SM000274S09994  [mRNA]  locus=s274:80135:87370:+ [translate_table: standard]